MVKARSRAFTSKWIFPNGRHPVTMDLHLAPGGDTMFGKIIRVDGTHRAMWNYLGATCPKPG